MRPVPPMSILAEPAARRCLSPSLMRTVGFAAFRRNSDQMRYLNASSQRRGAAETVRLA